jgi:EpsI family protein
MNRSFVVSLILGALMVSSAGVTKVMTPTIHLSETLPALVLDKAIPAQFGDWREEENLVSAVINPQAAAVIKKIYTQTLSRTYVNKQDNRIMLSIAYGKDQGDAVQVHYPEVCYPAQGFQVSSNRAGSLATPQGTIPVTRLETNLAGQRFEPVTYWTTVGNEAVSGGTSKKVAEMRYSLRGEIPDGLLLRVSSINTESQAAFSLQEVFIRDLIKELPPDLLSRIAGLGANHHR